MSNARWAWAAFYAIFLSYAWFCHAFNWQFHDALLGESPINWVYSVTGAEFFARDYYSVGFYESSGIMSLLRLMYTQLGMLPETLMPYMIAVEMLGLAGAAYVAARWARPGQPFVHALTVILVVGGGGANVNLGRWEVPFIHGLNYGQADFLRIFAMVCAFDRRYLTSAIALSLAFTCHASLGLTAAVCTVAAILCVRPSDLLTPRAILAGVVALFLCGGWALKTTGGGAFGTESVSDETWLTFGRHFSYHHFPVEFGTFTEFHWERFVPFMSFAILALLGLRAAEPREHRDRLALWASVAALLFTSLGFVLSVTSTRAMPVMLALHRTSDIAVWLLLPYVVSMWWQCLRAGPPWRAFMAGLLLVSAFTLRPPYPLALALAFSLPECVAVLRRRDVSFVSVALVLVSATSVAAVVAYASQGLIYKGWGFDTYTGLTKLMNSAALLAVLVGFMSVSRQCKSDLAAARRLTWIVGIPLLVIAGYRLATLVLLYVIVYAPSLAQPRIPAMIAGVLLVGLCWALLGIRRGTFALRVVVLTAVASALLAVDVLLAWRESGGSLDSMLLWLVFGAIAWTAYLVASTRGEHRISPAVMQVAGCSVVLMLSALWLWRARPYSSPEQTQLGRDYVAAQYWARNQTPTRALFMPDPSHAYGWRAFSQRSAIGNAREWGFQAWSYTLDKQLFEQGQEYFARLGVDPLGFPVRPGARAYADVVTAVQEAYYTATPEWFAAMSAEYEINYYLFFKSKIVQPIPLEPVYENASILIAAAPRGF